MPSFEEYMARSRAAMMKDLYKYDKQIAKMFDDLANQIIGELDRASTPLGRRHLQELIRVLKTESKSVLADYKTVMKEALDDSARIQLQYWQQGMKPYVQAMEREGLKYKTGAIMRAVQTDAVRAIYGRAYSDGLYLSNRIWNVTANTQRGITKIVTEGFTRGLHYDDPRIADQLKRFLQPSRMGVRTRPTVTRKIAQIDPKTGEKKIVEFTFRQRPVSFDAARLLRTEYASAYREAQHRTALQNPACYGELWSLSMEHPDLGCECEDYAQHDEGLGEGVFAVENTPLTPHPLCVVEGTVVSGPRVVGATSRWYDGEVVEISIGDGENLTVTPNHPILTPEGWVAAGLLNEGDKVVYSAVGKRNSSVISPAVLDPDDSQVPALVEEVYRAFGESVNVSSVTVPLTAEAFHGDGGGSEVCVIRTDSLLRDSFNASLLEHMLDKLFHWADMKLSSLAGYGPFALGLERSRYSTRGFVSGLGPLSVLLRSALGMYQSLGLLEISPLNSSSEQVFLDGVSVNPAFIGQGFFRLSSKVPRNEVRRRVPNLFGSKAHASINEESPHSAGLDAMLASKLLDGTAGDIVLRNVGAVRRYPFSGHVYNLQTIDGWYKGNNIITHNCLCDQTQVLAPMEEFMTWVDDFVHHNIGPLADFFA